MDTIDSLVARDNIKQDVIALVYRLGYLDSAISLYHRYDKTEMFNQSLATLDFHVKIQSKQKDIDVKFVLQKTPVLMNQYIQGYVDSIINETNLGSSFNQSLNDDDIYPSFVGFTFDQHETIEKLLLQKIDTQSLEEQLAFS